MFRVQPRWPTVTQKKLTCNICSKLHALWSLRVPLHLTVRQSSSLKTTGGGNSNDSWFYWVVFHKLLDGYQFSSVTFLLDPFLNWIRFHPFHMIIWIQKLRFLVSLFCCFDLWHGSSYFAFDSYWIGIQKTPENLQELDPATNSTLSRNHN